VALGALAIAWMALVGWVSYAKADFEAHATNQKATADHKQHQHAEGHDPDCECCREGHDHDHDHSHDH